MEKQLREALDDEYKQRQEAFDEQEAALIQELMREQKKNTSLNIEEGGSKEPSPDKEYGAEDDEYEEDVSE